MHSEMTAWLQCILILLMATTSILSHEATNPLQHQDVEQHEHQQQGNPEPQAAGRHHPGRTIDRNHVHDEEHLKDHLDGQVQSDEKLSDEEMQFRYFKVHDYDGNNMLDGIELIKALTHHHKSEGEEKRIPDDELSSMINEILEDNDRNFDGFIDYAEFIVSQRGENV